MIEHRPFHALGGVKTDWLFAKLHIAFAGMGSARAWPAGRFARLDQR
jgi:hypothetical protein